MPKTIQLKSHGALFGSVLKSVSFLLLCHPRGNECRWSSIKDCHLHQILWFGPHSGFNWWAEQVTQSLQVKISVLRGVTDLPRVAQLASEGAGPALSPALLKINTPPGSWYGARGPQGSEASADEQCGREEQCPKPHASQGKAALCCYAVTISRSACGTRECEPGLTAERQSSPGQAAAISSWARARARLPFTSNEMVATSSWEGGSEVEPSDPINLQMISQAKPET